MLSRLADRIALHLQTQKVIDPEEYELYQFGVRKLLSDIINMVSVVVIGILIDEIVACIVFSLAFRLIRPYAGGYLTGV